MPSWGTPTVAETPRRSAARDQRVELHSRLRSAHREGAVAPRRQLEDHGADADLRGRAVRRGERPRARAADLRRASGRDAATSRSPRETTSSSAVAWSRTGRGSYMPTPLVYKGQLYVLGKQRHLRRLQPEDRRRGLPAAPGARRQRVQRLAGGGRRQDLPVERGRRHHRRRRRPEFRQIATNPMGELLMATPALSAASMYVRTARSLFAIGSPSPAGR